jgi:hypothetical protein
MGKRSSREVKQGGKSFEARLFRLTYKLLALVYSDLA